MFPFVYVTVGSICVERSSDALSEKFPFSAHSLPDRQVECLESNVRQEELVLVVVAILVDVENVFVVIEYPRATEEIVGH